MDKGQTDQKGYEKVVMKADNNRPRTTNNQRKILRLILALGSPTLVAIKLGISQPAVTKTAKIMEEKGLLKITKLGHRMNEYVLTSKGFLELHGITEKVMQNRWRLHKIGIEYYVRPSLLKAWERRRNKISTIKVGLKNNNQGHFKLEGIPAKTTTKGVIIYPNDILGKERIEVDKKLIEVVEKAGRAINEHFKMPIWKGEQGNVEIISQELAHMEDPLANEYISQNLRMVITVNKKRRLIIDYSKVNGTPTPECEGVHRKECPEDMRKWEKHSKAIITGEFDHEAILKRLGALESVANKTTDILEHRNALKSINSEKQKGLMDYESYFG